MMANFLEIPVVMYHSVNNSQNNYPLSGLSFFTKELIAHLRFFYNSGYECISLSDLIQRALEGKLGKTRLAALTFDDGFLDNYLYVTDILNDFTAKGTIFVNPGHASKGSARTLATVPDAWGYLNFDEMRLLEQSGILEIQSHTFSHEDIFLTDRLIDLYTPEKFNLYYWLVWKINPHLRAEWSGDVTRFKDIIPNGYPIFEYGRCLRSKEFFPTNEFIEQCVQLYKSKGIESMNDLRLELNKGNYEPEESYFRRVDEQLLNSKRILESELSKHIECICFPGDVFSDFVLSRAQAAGYKVYIRPHWGKHINNLSTLKRAKQILFSNHMIGLQRIVFSYGYRGILPMETGAYWTAKITVGAAQGNSFYNGYLSTGRFVKRKILRIESKSRLQRNEN
jgi:peptidoglycan/xylan/chitin deacetylase (PgdA/CDA1 family)